MSVLERPADTEARPEREAEDDTQSRETGPGREPAQDRQPRPQNRQTLTSGSQAGLRIRHVRVKSAAKIAAVFFVLGYVVTIGTLVVLWNVAQGLGFVGDIEELVVTSLGLETFEIAGGELFELALIAFGLLFAMGLAITVLLTIVYNAACALFGGLAVETGSLRRSRRIYSLRQHRFVDA